MYLSNLKTTIIYYVLLVVISVMGSVAHANEGASSSVGVVEENYSGKQTQDWEAFQKNLVDLKNKLTQQEAVVEGLSLSHEKKVSSEKIEELKKEEEKLKSIKQEYLKTEEEFDTRFPEKGLKSKRIYTRSAKKEKTELDRELTLEEQLEIVHSKMLRQYSIKNQKSNSVDGQKTKIVPLKKAVEASKDVTDTIILSK